MPILLHETVPYEGKEKIKKSLNVCYVIHERKSFLTTAIFAYIFSIAKITLLRAIQKK